MNKDRSISPTYKTVIRGREYKGINLEYYINKKDFNSLRERKLSLKEIMSRINLRCSEANFIKLLKKNGWHDNKKVSKQKHSINEEFFSKWTKESAWVLGWILTDGNVTFSNRNKSIRFRLDSKDEDVLWKIKKLLNYSGCVVRKHEQKGIRSMLRIHRIKMCEDLYKLGIPKSDKTQSVRYPLIATGDFEGDFLRGVFEGDGSSSIRTDRGNTIEIFVVTGSEYFAKDYKHRLKMHGIKSTLSITTSNCYKVSIYRIADCLKFYYIIYQETTPLIRMDRKFNDFRNYIKNYKIQTRTNDQQKYWLSLIIRDILNDI